MSANPNTSQFVPQRQSEFAENKAPEGNLMTSRSGTLGGSSRRRLEALGCKALPDMAIFLWCLAPAIDWRHQEELGRTWQKTCAWSIARRLQALFSHNWSESHDRLRTTGDVHHENHLPAPAGMSQQPDCKLLPDSKTTERTERYSVCMLELIL